MKGDLDFRFQKAPNTEALCEKKTENVGWKATMFDTWKNHFFESDLFNEWLIRFTKLNDLYIELNWSDSFHKSPSQKHLMAQLSVNTTIQKFGSGKSF